MGKIAIDLPEHFVFQTELQVRVTDLNYGAHLGNDALLSMIHEARMLFLDRFGYSELDLAGVSLIMRDVAIVYKKEASFMDRLLFEVTAQDFSRKGFDVYYRVTLATNGQLVAEAKTGMVCYDYEQGAIKGVPEAFRKNFE